MRACVLIWCRCPRHPLSVSWLRLYSAAHVIVRCLGDVFEGHPVSPDTIADTVSSAMLIERPVGVNAVSDGHRI